MPNTAFALFESALGPMGIAWSPGGIVGLQLPEESGEATRQRLARRYPQAGEEPPPAAVHRVIEAVETLLTGRHVDLDFVDLDLGGVSGFERRIYAAARAIPFGRTMTYGEIAGEIGEPAAARAVGRALGANPFPIVVPCHRVLAAGGKAGGFSAHGGVDAKMRILSIENAARDDAPALFDDLPLAVRPRR